MNIEKHFSVMSSSDIFYSPQKPQSSHKLQQPTQQAQLHFISPMIQSKNPITQSPMFGDGVTTCNTSQQRCSTDETSGLHSSPTQKNSCLLLQDSSAADLSLESPLACYKIPQSLQNDLVEPEQNIRKSPRNAINRFEDDLIIQESDFDM